MRVYSRVRLHSSLDYQSPLEFERQQQASQQVEVAGPREEEFYTWFFRDPGMVVGDQPKRSKRRRKSFSRLGVETSS